MTRLDPTLHGDYAAQCITKYNGKVGLLLWPLDTHTHTHKLQLQLMLVIKQKKS